MGSIPSIPIDVQALQDSEAYWKEQYAIVMQENTLQREEISDLRDENSNLRDENGRCYARINDNESDRSYRQRVFSNKHMEPTHKLVLLTVRDEIRSRKVDQQGLTRIDYASVGEKVGLSRQTVGRRAEELVQWGAFGKYTDKVPAIVKGGRSINKDHVYLSLNTIAVEAPEDIKPSDEPTYTHGGKRERCKACGSTNVRRVHHVICEDCKHEHILYPLDIEQEQLIEEAFDAVQDEPHHTMATKAETTTAIDQAIEVIDQALFDAVQDEPHHDLDTQDAPITPETVTPTYVTLPNDAVQDEPHTHIEQRTCNACGETFTPVQHPTLNIKVCSCFFHPEKREAYRERKAANIHAIPTVNYATGQVDMTKFEGGHLQ